MQSPAPVPVPEVTAEFVADGRRSTGSPVAVCPESTPEYAMFVVQINSPGDKCPDRVAAQVSISCDEARYLDGQRRIVPLRHEIEPPWPTGCFAVVRRGEAWFQVFFGTHAHLRLTMQAGRLIARFTLRDSKRCGLRLIAEHRFLRSPFRGSIDITVCRLRTPEESVWVEPFPRAARAAICITDHPDWDSVPKLRALGELFGSNGIRITKAAFPATDPGWSRYGPGLDNPEYAAEIDRWHAAGHEIAYHGIGSGADISHLSPQECLARLDRLLRYRPETWIDHGCGEYGFTRAARLPGDMSLVEVLRARGVRNFWSYGDVWQNPADDLNIWKRRTLPGSFADALRLAIRRGRMTPMQLAYYGVIPLKNLGGTVEPMKVLRRPWSLENWRRLVANYRRLREINAAPLFVYDFSGDFAPQRPDEPWIFDTLVVQHLVSQFSPANISRLIAANGMLIAHTYLAAQHARGGDNCFKLGAPAEILDAFRENIANIGRLQSGDDVATLPLRELRERLCAHAASRVVRRDGGWEVSCHGVVCSRAPHRIDGTQMQRRRDGLFSTEIAGSAYLKCE
jgi:hypothetical protein